MRGTRKRIWLLIAMVSLLMLALGAAASAQVQDGPDIPELGDPATVPGTAVVPHGGYSASTNFCLQCHDVHGDENTGDYALMTNPNVTDTCGTCHIVDGVTTSVPGSGSGSGALGTVSTRTVYDEGRNGGASIGHGLGTRGAMITSSAWDYDTYPLAVDAADLAIPPFNTPGTATDAAGGFYCATCHTPHGDYGQMVNQWAENDEIQYDWPAGMPTALDPEGWASAYVQAAGVSWNLCRETAPLANCMPATIQDAEDQKVSLYGYKLLSAYPNHTYSTLQTYNTALYNQDSANWCTTCHVEQGPTGSFHNHVGGCVGCHGNPSDDASNDFPHSSTMDSFLVDYPDLICINCHTPGSLP